MSPWKTAFRLIMPALSLILVFLVASGIAIHHLAGVTDQTDALRSRAMVEAAINMRLTAIEALAYDIGYWDDGARHLYDPASRDDFMRETFQVATEEGHAYSGVHLYTSKDRAVAGLSQGRWLDPAKMEWDPGAVVHFRRRLSGDDTRTVSGLHFRRGQLYLVGIAELRPTNAELKGIIPAEGAWKIVVTQLVNEAVLQEIHDALLLDGLRLGPPAEGELDVALLAGSGAKVAHLSWQPTRPGQQALARAAPMLALVALVAILLGAMAAVNGYRAASDLARQAMLDALSGLPNRRAFRRAVARALISGDEATVAILDLDGFKSVNDNHGHVTGDQLILEVAHLLAELAGDDVMLGRLGGDEFALLVRGPESARRAEEIGRQLLRRMAQPFQLGPLALSVGVSVGHATGTLAETDTSELLRRADVAMYAAKRRGKGQVAAFDCADDRVQADLHRRDRELREALAAKAIALCYQPLVDAKGRRILGVEALARWTSPTEGPVPPAVFVAAAEETGLIHELGLYVLEQACRDLRPLQPLTLSVNLSPAQLRSAGLAASIEAILERTGLPAARLELELTETSLVDDGERAGETLRRLASLGVGLALDDFGTGFASIGFLRRFPFRRLKIDRSLIEAAEAQGGHDLAVLEATVEMAHALGLELVAEGIETPAQAALVEALGCHAQQGWLYYPALPLDEVAALVAVPASA